MQHPMSELVGQAKPKPIIVTLVHELMLIDIDNI
jgi:hypothetical protein